MLRLRWRYLLICASIILATAIFSGLQIAGGDYLALTDDKMHFGILPTLSPASQAAALAEYYCFIFFWCGLFASSGIRERLASGATRRREYLTSIAVSLLLALLALAASASMLPVASGIPGPLNSVGSAPLPAAFAFAYARFVIMFLLGYALAVTYRATGGAAILAFAFVIFFLDVLLQQFGMPLILADATVPETGTNFPAGVALWLAFGVAMALIGRGSVRSLRVRS